MDWLECSGAGTEGRRTMLGFKKPKLGPKKVKGVKKVKVLKPRKALKAKKPG